MRTLLVVLAVLLAVTSVATAAEWGGVGVQIGLNSSKLISADTTAVWTKTISTTANVTMFGVPRNGNGLNVGFAYAGPTWNWDRKGGSQYYIQPQFGWVGNWFKDDGTVVALWTGGTIPGSKLSLDLDLESINGGSQHDYFGWYKLSLPAGPIKIGAGVEQLNSKYSGCVFAKLGGIEYRQYMDLKHSGNYCGRFCASVNL